MIIDFTQLSTYLKNPREYQISHVLKLEPAVKPIYFAVGSYVHLRMEGRAKGWSEEEVAQRIIEKGVAHIEGEGDVYYDALCEYRDDNPVDVVASEVLWEYQIPGSHHVMTGKIDEIAEVFGVHIPGDIKTMSERWALKGTIEEMEQEWGAGEWEGKGTVTGLQANFGLIGARIAGYEVDGRFKVTVVTKVKKPEVFTVDVNRTDEEMTQFVELVKYVADHIEYDLETRGPNVPWGHVVQGRWSGYTCAGRSKNFDCQFADLCGKVIEGVPEGWCKREDYLKEEDVA